MSLRPLRPHQVAALDGLKASLMAGHRRPMLSSPTGSGKTVLAAHIVAGAMAKHKRVAFCVPALSLVDQTFERFQENGISPLDMGIQQADHPWRREFAPVQIATAQTLSRRALPQADVVVIDEAHIRFAVYERWMRDHPQTVFIGLSATPWSQGLGRLFDDLVKPVTIAELIDAGLLSRFRVFAPSKPDLEGVKTVAGDYHEGQLAERMNQPTLVADIVETWLARGENRPTLCFATGRKHARAIHDEFRIVGVPAAYVDANTPRAEREAIGRALAAGEVKIVCNIGTLTTGIDWDVRCIILARPTKSESLFVQIVGRGLRTADGKPDCVLLDHSDTHQRLGFVTDIDCDGLDMGRAAKASSKAREKKPRLPVCCAHCTALMPVLAKACDVCGHALPEPKFEVGEGELVEMRGGKSKPAPDSPKALLIALGKQAVYGQIKAIQMERGRSDGWAAHTYRSIFDVWPLGLGSLPQEPGTQLRAWVRHRDIAFSKSRKAHQEASHAAL